MRWSLPLVTLLVACGRFEFDASSDASGDGDGDGDGDGGGAACAPAGHDEDSDGLDDACDLCPQRTDNGLDGDGDGIGDDCDVSPLQQTRELFDPFTVPRDEWSIVLGTYTGDAVRFDTLAAGSGASLAAAPGRETFEVTGNLVLGNAATAQVVLAIGDFDPAPAHYYCEIYDDGSAVALLLTYTLDGAAYMTIDSAALPGRFDSGPFRIIYEHTPPTSTCWAEWNGARVRVTGTNPSGVPLNQVGVGVFQARVDLLSFVRLANP